MTPRFPRRRCRHGWPRGLLIAALCAGLLAGLGTVSAFPLHAAPDTPIEEDFDATHGGAPVDWQPVIFGHRAPTQYRVAREDGRSVLRAEADASASSLVWQHEFNPRLLNKLSWEWKISGVLPEGDLSRKDREDLPARVMVLFPFDAERASLWERLVHKLLTLRYGEEPPGEALIYAWSNHDAAGTWHTSVHTSRVSILVVQSGDVQARHWVMDMRDIAADYRERFGRPVPSRARIAVMVDTDDTRSRTVTWFDSFRLMPGPATAAK